MATFSLGTGVTPGAPGTFINERAGNIASAGIATFNTTYMLVETEENVPVTRFPFNKPVPVTSLEDYKALVGGVPDTKIPLLSYNCVNSFFLNAQVGDLRVVRVGTPDQISEIEIFPSGTKISSSGLPSALEAGNIVYAQLILNAQKLVAGDGTTGYNSDGEWLGVPVTIPVDYIPGDEVNNRKISTAIVTAIVEAIRSNPSVSSSVYVRDFGLENDINPSSNSETGFIQLAATTYNGNVSVITEQLPVGAQSVLMQNTYDVQNVVGTSYLERTPQDYIQCINTAFDGQLNQGYLIAPTAFAQFDAEGRTEVGQAAAEHCQSNNFKWMALADAGPYLVTDINKYKDFSPHEAAEDLVTDTLYLVDNAIYRWIGANVSYDRLPFQTISAGNDPQVPVELSEGSVADGEKVGIIDLAQYVASSDSGFAEYGVFSLNTDTIWPAEYQIQKVTLSSAGADFSSLPGEVYFVAPPFDSLVYGPYPSDGSSQYVFITETAAEASSVLTAVTALGGTSKVLDAMSAPTNAFVVASPTGSTVEATYQTPQWNLPVKINGQTSNLIQNTSGASAPVNTLHLPGTLQDPTEDYKLDFVSRTFFDPSSAISESSVSGFVGAAEFNCVSHGLVDGQKVFFTQPILADGDVFIKATTRNSIHSYFVKAIDNDNFVLSTSYGNSLSGSYIPYPDGSPTISSQASILYTGVLGGGTTSVSLSELSNLPLIRGRKYGMSTGTIAEEAAENSSFSPSGDNPTVSIFLNTSSLVTGKEKVFPFGETTSAGWLPSLSLVAPGTTVTTIENYLCTPTVSQSYASNAYIVPSIGSILGGDYNGATGGLTNLSYYAGTFGLNSLTTPAEFQATVFDEATGLSLDGVYFDVVADGSTPDGSLPVVTGDRMAVVFNGSSYNWVVIPASSEGGDLTSVAHICYGAQVEISLTAEQTPPASLWRFDAITPTEIIDQALRGVGFSGEPQALFVEAGVDNVNRLYEDSQRYFNAFGFVAFYGPYVENSADQYIPPSPYVTGIALRRYRAEGFQFPPAGTKYQLADAIGVQIAVNSAQQDLLNPDGCNVLRSLPGYPVTSVFVWGGRTRINKAVADQRKFQFVNTRVIQNVIYGSLRSAFDNQIFSIIDGFGVVFNQIVSIGNSVMSQLYNVGALYGAKPSDAFQVICDERINTPENLENGIVFVKVFDVPAPTLERIQVDLIRVSLGQMGNEVESQGL